MSPPPCRRLGIKVPQPKMYFRYLEILLVWHLPLASRLALSIRWIWKAMDNLGPVGCHAAGRPHLGVGPFSRRGRYGWPNQCANQTGRRAQSRRQCTGFSWVTPDGFQSGLNSRGAWQVGVSTALTVGWPRTSECKAKPTPPTLLIP